MERLWIHPSSVGELILTDNGREDAPALTRVVWRRPADETAFSREQSPLLKEAARQIDQYLAGERRAFSLPYTLTGTPFQREVWEALASLPYGETIAYAELARRLGRPKAVRAVGRACGQNPLSLILPCHRVVGARGRLTGYAGGVEIKERLLRLEGVL